MSNTNNVRVKVGGDVTTPTADAVFVTSAAATTAAVDTCTTCLQKLGVQNLGSGSSLYLGKATDGVGLQFRTITGRTGVTIDYDNQNLFVSGSALSQHIVLGVLKSANFNSTADQAITINCRTSSATGYIAAATKYIISDIRVINGSVSLTTAQGAFYTAASKGGTIIGATTTAYTGVTGATAMHKLSGITNMDTTVFTAATLYLSLTTVQGSAATADVYIMGYPIS